MFTGVKSSMKSVPSPCSDTWFSRVVEMEEEPISPSPQGGIPPHQMVLHRSLAVCSDQWSACAVSPWIMLTVMSGYRLQFVVCPAHFCSVITSTVHEASVPVLWKYPPFSRSRQSKWLLCGRSGTAGTAGIHGYEKGRDFALCSRPTCPQQVSQSLHAQNAHELPAVTAIGWWRWSRGGKHCYTHPCYCPIFSL